MAGGASGPEAFTPLLRLLVTHFDRVETGGCYAKLYTFGMCNGTLFYDFSREFRVLVSTATGSERVLLPPRRQFFSPGKIKRKIVTHHSGQSRGHNQDHGQVNRYNDNIYTSDHHGGMPPPPASSALAPTPGMRSGAAHNPGGNPNASQPGTFCTGN